MNSATINDGHTYRVDEQLDAASAYLSRWHAEHTGATGVVLGDLRDTAGRASYDILAEAVVGRSPALDLACGDGPLIEAVGARTFVIGGDRSEAELRAARERLGDRAPLLQVAATALPVRDAVLACVACHFALMLLQPLENVLQEVRRVLRPGGRLVLALPAASGVEGGVWQALRAAMAAATAVERFNPPSLQDDRVLVDVELSSLLEQNGLVVVDRSDHEFRAAIPVEAATTRLGLTYGPGLLAPQARARFDDVLLREVRRLARSDGTVDFSMSVHRIVAERTR